MSPLPVKSSSQTGKLVIISGPSGAGKTTVLKRLFAEANVPLTRSVSATTRPPRPGEVEGEDYYFLSAEEFARRRANSEFLETCEVFRGGHWYGTLHAEVTPSLAAGKWVVLEIDVQGTLAVLSTYPEAITIFLQPSSLAELERRLRARGTETEEVLARRLETARRELAAAGSYRWRVTNVEVGQAVHEICQILDSCVAMT